MLHKLDSLPHLSLGALLVRSIDRYKTIFEVPVNNPDLAEEDARWVVDLVEGVERAMIDLAREEQPTRDDLKYLLDVAGSVWVIVAEKLWYEAACALMFVTREMLETYTVNGQRAMQVDLVTMQDKEGGSAKIVYAYGRDDNTIRAKMAGSITRLVSALSEYDKNSDLALATQHDYRALEVPRVADDYLSAKLIDISGLTPLGTSWPNGVPQWLIDPGNYKW